MGPVRVTHRDRVALIELCRGVTNPLDLELLEALSDALEEAAGDPQTDGVVLASASPKFFSIGFDIPRLFPLPRGEFAVFFRCFNRICLDLFTCPKPTVAAITGHAVAGGCILALCCDRRLIAAGRKLMGLNEVKLGVPIPYPGDRILRDLVGSRIAREVVEGGEFHPAKDLLAMGLVDEVLPGAEVLDRAVREAASRGGRPRIAFSLIKRDGVREVEEATRSRLAERERSFLDCWFAEETRRILEEAMAKF